MSEKWIQQKRNSKELNELLKYEHNCFILLTQIAQRAKRTNKFSAEGLEINQALIGDYKTIGLTEQKYRTAKNKLKKWQFITVQTTNKGTIATLLNTSIYDINAEQDNEQDNERVTNKQRTDNERVTTNKNVKKEKNVKNVKNLKEIYKEKYLDSVFLTKEEYQKLIDKFGEVLAKDYIERLDNYMGSKGMKYASHYKTILVWADKNKPQQTNRIKSHDELYDKGTVI